MHVPFFALSVRLLFVVPRLYLPWPEEGKNGVSSMYRFHDIERGLIARSRSEGVDSFNEEVRRHAPAGDGRSRLVFIEEASEVFNTRQLQSRARFVHAETEGRTWVEEYTKERFAEREKVRGRIALKFDDVTFEEAATRGTVPTGSGVDALRTAWDASYRYHDGMAVHGRFSVKTPRASSDWLGRKETTGEFTFEGWRGGRSPYATSEVKIDRARGEDAEALRTVFGARNTIWTRQEPAGRGSFDEAFAGAKIEERTDGLFQIDHPKLRQVRVRAGRIKSIVLQDGTRNEFRWEKQHDRFVPTEVRQSLGEHESVVTLEWGPVPEREGSPAGQLFPTKVTIEDWFHEGWGPEVYEFELR